MRRATGREERSAEEESSQLPHKTEPINRPNKKSLLSPLSQFEPELEGSWSEQDINQLAQPAELKAQLQREGSPVEHS